MNHRIQINYDSIIKGIQFLKGCSHKILCPYIAVFGYSHFLLYREHKKNHAMLADEVISGFFQQLVFYVVLFECHMPF